MSITTSADAGVTSYQDPGEGNEFDATQVTDELGRRFDQQNYTQCANKLSCVCCTVTVGYSDERKESDTDRVFLENATENRRSEITVTLSHGMKRFKLEFESSLHGRDRVLTGVGAETAFYGTLSDGSPCFGDLADIPQVTDPRPTSMGHLSIDITNHVSEPPHDMRITLTRLNKSNSINTPKPDVRDELCQSTGNKRQRTAEEVAKTTKRRRHSTAGGY
ncbi:hypothetical protein B0T10DRAFT_551883 [Thelonectria olida]|uniref:Uncharacterized protein n=1 Tax=Thelonectria olida TaxID=1576542 RepID=A0A9P9AH77_9HYPO|nr:hypothetical protein B0T10DRAFT_551883 [Thelonectria olida]